MATPPKNKSNRFGLFGGFKPLKSFKIKPKNARLADRDAKRRKKEQEKQQKAAALAAKPTKVKTGKTPTSKIPTVSTSTPKLTSTDYKPHFIKKRQARKVKIIGKLEESLPAVIEPSTVIDTGNKKLDAYVVKQGPPVKMKDAVKNFKKEHDKTFVRKGKVFARDKRKFRDVSKFVKFIVKDKYLEDKVKGIKA